MDRDALMIDKLKKAIDASGNNACLGLYPHAHGWKSRDVFQTNVETIESTCEAVAGYRLQFAFYEALGREGYDDLERTIRHIRRVAPNAFIIGDAMRGDIGSTASAYARAMFDVWDCDATTVSAFLGSDGLIPFMNPEHSDRGIFVACRTSNPSADELQMVGDPPLYESVAQIVSKLPKGRAGLIIDVDCVDEAGSLRETYPYLPIMITIQDKEYCLVTV